LVHLYRFRTAASDILRTLQDSHVLREYLARNGAICPDNANPAEYMLEAIGAGSGRQVGNKDWADIWNDSEEFQVVKREIEDLKREGLAMPEDTDPALKRECKCDGFSSPQRLY
jgi:hypothetical protein